MLANIGINQSALFLAIFSIDNSALPISVSASRRLTSKASKLAQIKGVVDQIRRWMAVPQPVDTTQFTGWRTGIPSPISLFITFTPARISPTWAL